MKKLLGIIFLSLLLSGNSSSASKQAYFCEDTMSVHRYAADWCGKRLGMEEFVYRRLTSENIHNENKFKKFRHIEALYSEFDWVGLNFDVLNILILENSTLKQAYRDFLRRGETEIVQLENDILNKKTKKVSNNNTQKIKKINTQKKSNDTMQNISSENINKFTKTFRKLDTIYKDNDKIYVVLDYWGTKAIGIANNHCSSMGKRTFWTDEYRSRYKKHFKDKGYKIKGSVAEFLCSKTKLNRATNNSLTPGFKVTEVSDEQPNNQTASSSQQVDINFNISEKRQQCEAIGFTPNSEKFADCVLRLVELDMKNQQTNNMMTSQKKSQSDQFMSNALLNIGQQLMQPNSSVNNSRTRNCSVRKSFGNTSTVTCY